MMLLGEILTLPIKEKVLVLHLRGEDTDPTAYPQAVPGRDHKTLCPSTVHTLALLHGRLSASGRLPAGA